MKRRTSSTKSSRWKTDFGIFTGVFQGAPYNNKNVLPWKRKSVQIEIGPSNGFSSVLANCVGSLKLLVIAPREDKSVRYVTEIESHLQNSALGDEQVAQRIRSASESFSKHQREAIETIISDLDRSLRGMLGSLDEALSSGDKMMGRVSGSSRKLSSMSDLKTFEELRQKVAEEVSVLASAIAEYRVTNQALHEKYKREIECMRATLDKAQMAAKVDSLTNLPNRTCHEYHMAATLMDAEKGKKFALAIIDMDGFKEINDTHGHLAGDAALVCFTRALCNFLGRDTFVARLGGDEFTVIADGTSEMLEKRLGDFRSKLLQTKVDLGPTKATLSISYGVANIVAKGSYQVIMKEADEKMYIFKRSVKIGRVA